MNTILVSFRILNNLDESFVANELSLPLTEYKDLESGKVKIQPEVCCKLSVLYNAPPQVFMEVNSVSFYSITYSQCHFENSTGYVNNMQNDNVNFKDFFQILQEEISRLRKENDMLIGLLLSNCNLNSQES